MNTLRNILVGLIILVPLAAQGVIQVPQNPLVPNTYTLVTYTNPNRVGELITVEIDDGRKPTTTYYVPIQLDENGFGMTLWHVPVWDMALFNAPDAREVARMIQDPPPSK